MLLRKNRGIYRILILYLHVLTVHYIPTDIIAIGNTMDTPTITVTNTENRQEYTKAYKTLRFTLVFNFSCGLFG